MTDRVPADHPSVETVRATLARRGGTHRAAIRLPADASFDPTDDVVRLVLDGTERRAPVGTTTDGRPTIQGAYESPRLARDRSGTDHLANWVDDRDLDFGRTVLLDVVVPDFRYGVRAPGEDATYDASQPPSGGLRDVARDLEG